VTNLQQICGNAVPTTCQRHVFALLVPTAWADLGFFKNFVAEHRRGGGGGGGGVAKRINLYPVLRKNVTRLSLIYMNAQKIFKYSDAVL
jgi:hypothetical protein